MTSIIPTTRAPLTTSTSGSRIELAIAAWLDAKHGRSSSAKTLTAYRDTLGHFRAALASTDLDLDSDPSAIALVAQAWAGRRDALHPKATRRGPITPATYNQRLAIVSSFYTYAMRRKLLPSENPIDQVERRQIQRYAQATALTAETISATMKGIDRSTLVGQRDYALLAVALATGQRASELAGLRCGDIQRTTPMVLTFQRTKGGKRVKKPLPPATAQALARYLDAVYGVTWPKDGAVWVSDSNRAKGAPLSLAGLSDICQRHLGTAKIHTLRHTFAKALERDGTPISEIQKLLGHANAATTSEYLQSLDVVDSTHVASIEQLFGIE